MDRRMFMGVLGVAFVTPLASEAQQGRKVIRVGFLLGGSVSSPGIYIDTFRRALSDLGWVEGRNVAMEYRFANGNYAQLPKLAAELVSLGADIIITEGTAPALAAKQATSTIPIVMAIAGDPVGTGLVASLRQPSGNITGLGMFFTEINVKRLEILKDVVPSIARLGVLWNPANPLHPPAVMAIEKAAELLRMKVQHFKVQTPADFDHALSSMTKKVVDAVTVVEDQLINVQSRRLVEVAAKNQLPMIFGLANVVEGGGLMSYAPDRRDLWRRTAYFVDKILKGAKPADLPIEQPTKFELVINLKTAKTLGIKIPQSILLRADRVIE